ncbi:hypothetical protein [Rathayibacter sp. SD072]|uniref:hypothetical protein n=1 Tax=Rathayibacter sp. SD072 TaxID=2781731 RepID=UPI001A978788|nr:hypothetical protein [Rathayibacter sp. SD072]MBO0984094.1 hypothetical protein [Rathayibacter sp. SD072]
MTHDVTPSPLDVERVVTRRSVAAATAWTVPVVAVAVATPSAAASIAEVGPFALRGTCGILGIVGPGFTLRAGPTTPLPVGATVVVTGSGVADIGFFSVSGGSADVLVLSGTGRQIVLTADVPAGATITFRTTVSISVAFRLSAVASLPTGCAGSGAETAGFVSSTLILCSAN